jgi:hypothetical protein
MKNSQILFCKTERLVQREIMYKEFGEESVALEKWLGPAFKWFETASVSESDWSMLALLPSILDQLLRGTITVVNDRLGTFDWARALQDWE